MTKEVGGINIEILNGPNQRDIIRSLCGEEPQISFLVVYRSGPFHDTNKNVVCKVVMLDTRRASDNIFELEALAISGQHQLRIMYNPYDRKGVGLIS